MGRAVLESAEKMSAAQAAQVATVRRAPGSASYPEGLSPAPAVSVPDGLPGLLPTVGVRAFNAMRWRAAPRVERERPRPLHSYFFPLDFVGGWNRLYGPGGFLQYQLALPDGADDALRASFELIAARRLPVYLAVLKRFGAAGGGPLSFPLRGVTLALDLPAQASGVRAALDELDGLVAGAGGRVYLSKDARMRPESLRAMYPRLAEFDDVRARVDPDRVLRSDLARRVGLAGDGR
jgi:decaprenylphospho-beta-D-ribofuranose 2-oxidase